MTETRRNAIVIVGGGATGVILAAHFLRSPNPDLRITVVERREKIGRGLAYSTSEPRHLLNVLATGMSALAAEPLHFVNWLQARLAGRADPFFAPRMIYGDYLADLAAGLAETEPKRFRTVHQDAVAVNPLQSGVEVALANGSVLAAHVAVLALGHDVGPSPLSPLAIRQEDPQFDAIDSDSEVLILGTGLSMVDAWLSLSARGHRARVTALSRRGLLPSAHSLNQPLRLDSADIPLGTELSYFVGWFHDTLREVTERGGNWRDLVDGLRPFNQRIWQSWPATAKKRFLEHTKAWWDIHRHRMAPSVHAEIAQAIADDRLRVVAGRLGSLDGEPGALRATIRPRGGSGAQTLKAGGVIDCSGLLKDVSDSSIPILRSLIGHGMARPDAMRIGLDVTNDCALIDANGRASKSIYAAGPLTRGTFFEIDAVPEIRAQARALAARLGS